MNTNLNYRHSAHTDMHWKTALRRIEDAIGEYLVMNEEPIKDHKKNYFRFYINQNPLTYVGVLFDNDGNIIFYDYREGEIKNDTLFTRGGWWRGSKIQVEKFVAYVHHMLYLKSFHRTENEHRLFFLIDHYVSHVQKI